MMMPPRWGFGGKSFLRLIAKGFTVAIAAGKQSLVIESADLALECAGVPILGGSLVHVPLAGRWFLDTEQCPVVRPTQFVTQCVTFWECVVKQPHVAEIGGVEAPAKLGGESRGKLCQQGFSVGSTGFATLLKLHDVTPNQPAGADLDDIHRAESLLPGLVNDGAQVFQQCRNRGGDRAGIRRND